uniref:hypothetical protein n=1 Tax=Scytonema sp. HK-05 TaxID=1137095 RepID=UPI001E44EC72|nr:hypothetical protein [Scytonema sp. HK-05]
MLVVLERFGLWLVPYYSEQEYCCYCWLCCRAALVVMAISGRLLAIANRINPPSASPSPRRDDNTSVVLDS